MKFVAEDGTVFDTMDECKKHEEGKRKIGIECVPHRIFTCEELFGGGSCNLYVFFKIFSEIADEQFKDWVRSIGNDLYLSIKNDSFVGKTMVVDCCNDIDNGLQHVCCIYSIETVEEHVFNYALKIINIVDDID